MRYFVFSALILSLALPCWGQEGRSMDMDAGATISASFCSIYCSDEPSDSSAFFIGTRTHVIFNEKADSIYECGRWLKVIGEDLAQDTYGGRIIEFWCPNDIPLPDSVWVFYLDRNAIMDTVGTIDSDWEEVAYQRYCDEIWECVREKLIEFLKEEGR